MRYQIILRPEPEGGYTVFVPTLPGCITWGRTLPLARKMAADAIGDDIESVPKHGEPIPVDDDNLTANVEIELPSELSRA